MGYNVQDVSSADIAKSGNYEDCADLDVSENKDTPKMDKQNNLLDIAEKKRISDFASNGFYYFKHGKDYVDSIEEIILNDERIEREFYVIPTYKKLLNRGFRLKIFLVDKNWIMGTPEELDAFNRNFKHEK